MSLSWVNKFAKNALLNAQKRIDLVLDINEIDEEDGEPSISDLESPHLSTLFDNSEVDDSSDIARFSGNKESFRTSHEDGNSHLVDVDLDEKNAAEWNLSPVEDVVESEPNPIRDAHDQPSTSILHYSPSSNSPDEDEQQHHQNEHFDLSLINFEQNESLVDSIPVTNRARFDRQHEDVVTVASSDIVVIKNADDWSVASGSHRRTGSDQMSVSASIPNQKNSDDESIHEKIITLEAKLKHQKDRLDELGRLNESLRSQNTTLAQRNKQMSNKLAAEMKLQNQLVEKDAELEQLKSEGKSLSQKNARQLKELKRLRDAETELEAMMMKLNDANEEIARRTEMESQLKDRLRKLDNKLGEKNAEIVAIQEKVNRKQEMAEDFKVSEQRCQNQKTEIAKLEQRIDELMTTQRASAEQIAELNAPLLANIEELESKLQDSESDKYLLQKKVRLIEESVEAATRKSADEIGLLKQQLETLKNLNASAQERIQKQKSNYEELNQQHSKVNSLFQSVELKLQAEIAELKDMLVKKDVEIGELKQELIFASNSKMSVSPSVITPAEPHPIVLENLHELERENKVLRIEFNKLQNAHETLLLLHGEGVIRMQELEDENRNIKELCREQALMVASINESG